MRAIAAAPRKFRNVPTEVGEHTFSSRKEARRFAELKLLERAGEIAELKIQPVFRLEVAGQLICKYVADFSYHPTFQGAVMAQVVVEDVKSEITRKHPVYRLKNKLFRALMGFPITEV
jgi:hypothetical protein